MTQDITILSKSEIVRKLDNMALSADVKIIMDQIANTTAQVGGKIVYIGRQILSFIFDVIRQYPNTVFGALVGFVMSALIGSIPFVGVALGALLGPLLIALAIGVGAFADMSNSKIVAMVKAYEAELKLIQEKKL